MRSTVVFASLLLCMPLIADCSGGGQSMNSLPSLSTSSNATVPNAQSAMGASATVIASAPPLAAAAQTRASVSSAVAVVPAVTASNFVFPSDFPTGAIAGTRSRFTDPKWNEGGPAIPTITISGPGAAGGKTIVFTRPDGTSIAVLYYPTNVKIDDIWFALHSTISVRIPFDSWYSDKGTWWDTTPTLGFETTHYFSPTRVVLFYLDGPATASPSPAPSASIRPTAAPSGPLPTASPTVSPRHSPSPKPTVAPTDPPIASGAACQHFSSSTECHNLPSNPHVSGSSDAWAALNFQSGRNWMPGFNATVGPNSFKNPNDGSDPPLDRVTSSTPTLSAKIDCNASSWGIGVCSSFGVQGKTIKFPIGFQPAGNSDHHYSIASDLAGGEYDFWLVQDIPQNGGTIRAGGGGFCPWSGDGSNCSGSTATNLATSLGAIRESDFAAGEASSNGSFGHAISFAVLCADPSFVAPATASDGANTNSSSACNGHTRSGDRPPEGIRFFLDKTDAEVNAMNLHSYEKAWWRTLDKEHQGGYIADTNWSGAPGLSAGYLRDDFSAQAREAGVSNAPYTTVPMGMGSIDLKKDIKFCSNGSC